MHENILPSVGSNQLSSYVSRGWSNSSSIQPNYPTVHKNTPNEDNQHTPHISVSPVVAGTGSIAHNVTRMLEDSAQTLRSQPPSTSPRATLYSPYSSAHLMSFRHNILHKHSLIGDSGVSQEDSTSDISNSDMSISTEGSVSPNSSSAVTPPPPNDDSSTKSDSPSSVHFSPLDKTTSSTDSSPSDVSLPSVATSPYSSRIPNTDRANKVENNAAQPKKKARTNFTNEQVQSLLKIFHETPYPDSDMMESIGKDLGISEKQVKIWFQNKRARWRRRVNDNKNNNQQSFLPVSPMLSPVSPYGYMPTGHMMTSSPLQNFPGCFSYPLMQGNNNQRLPGQTLANQIPPRYQTANHSAAWQNQSSSTVTTMPLADSLSSAQYGRTLPQPNITTNQTSYLFQYPGYM